MSSGNEIQYINGLMMIGDTLLISFGAGDCSSYFATIACGNYSSLWTCIASRIAKQAKKQRSDQSSKVIVWEGPLLGHSSFALVARELGQHLAGALSQSASLIFHPIDDEEARVDLPRVIQDRLIRSPAEIPERPDAIIRMMWPIDFSKPPGGAKLILYIPWEFYHIPDHWVYRMNEDYITQIWVPSSFNLRGFLASGVRASKVRVLEHGYDHIRRIQKVCSYQRRSNAPTFEKRKASTVFYINAGGLHRKGLDVAVQAFLSAFKNSEEVLLLIHTRYGAFSNLLEKLVKKNIQVITEDWSDCESVHVLQSIDFYLHTARCEGFGFGPLEALALNKIVIGQLMTGERDYVRKNRILAMKTSVSVCTDGPCRCELQIQIFQIHFLSRYELLSIFDNAIVEGSLFRVRTLSRIRFLGNSCRDPLSFLSQMQIIYPTCYGMVTSTKLDLPPQASIGIHGKISLERHANI